ncbi:uncharacterized protein VTP21DRAFT_3185 [Calcarisporiella thermophila]|uniref:uncharacterized protein n=1 Tax=Calcarisporiella thermophila TaxID=911321 RepID=UPI0037430B9E
MFRKSSKPYGYEMPLNLAQLGYKLDEVGRVVLIENGEPYKYEVKKDDKIFNEALYIALLDTLAIEVERRLLDAGLQKIRLPTVEPGLDDPDAPHTKFFMSKNAMASPEKLMLIIPTQSVHAAVWSNRIMVNDGIDRGSIVGYVHRAIKEGYEVIVFNPSEIYWLVGGKRVVPKIDERRWKKSIPIPENESPEEHCVNVVDKFVRKSNAKNIFIVAHAWGATLAVDMLNREMEYFYPLTRAVALINPACRPTELELDYNVIHVESSEASEVPDQVIYLEEDRIFKYFEEKTG